MRLYFLDRVESTEKLEDFQNWLNKSKPSREKISKKSLETANNRRQELFEYIDNLDIDIEKIEIKSLRRLSRQHYENLWDSRGKFKMVEPGANAEFLNRIAVNMLRHENSNYEEELSEIFGRVGVDEAYIKLKNKVLDKIAEVYPFLKNECEKQKL